MAFPNAFTAAVDAVTTVAAALINQLETKVGVNNSTDPNSLDYKIAHLMSSLTGIIVPFGGASAPTGFLLCDGSAVSRTTYATLFGIIGTAYGVGNGSSTFNLPDLRQRFPLGKAASGTGDTLGATGGAINGSHTHTTPAHTHTLPQGTQFNTGDLPCVVGSGTDSGGNGTSGSADVTPPYQVVNYIIKY